MTHATGFYLDIVKKYVLKLISFSHSGAGFILRNMTPKTFFEKYKRVIIPFQLKLDERAFGISHEGGSDKAITAKTFILKKYTDRDKIKALATTFTGNDPGEVFQDLLSLQMLCKEKE